MKELYHATAPTRLSGILEKGFTDRGDSKFQGNAGQRGVSTTHDFSVVSGGNFGNLILVLDGAKLSNYELASTDYWGDDREKEVRIVSKQEGETIVPPEAIKKLVFISPKMARFEIKNLRQHGIPIESFWKGETTTYGEDGRAINEGTMKHLMENWRKFINEGIDPRIQKKIDELPDNIVIEITDEDSFGMMFRYKNTTGAPSSLFGEVEINPSVQPPSYKSDVGDGPCLEAWTVLISGAQKGWGPLLYEVALEWASQNGGGLASDRRSVSKKAAAVWDKYLQRADVVKKQLDALNRDVEKLTPEDPTDDCLQNSAIRSSGKEGWMDDPLSKIYFKSSTEVMSALKEKGKLEMNLSEGKK